MNQSSKTFPKSSTDPLKVTASAVNYLIKILPKGTAYCIGIVLVVMMTGRLVQSKGSLARAVLPLVFHLKWGWHRVERAMERGKVPLDKLFDRAFSWCVSNLPVEPVVLGEKQREVLAIDSSTIARWRAKAGMELLGKGFHHRAGKAIKANIIAASTTNNRWFLDLGKSLNTAATAASQLSPNLTRRTNPTRTLEMNTTVVTAAMMLALMAFPARW